MKRAAGLLLIALCGQMGAAQTPALAAPDDEYWWAQWNMRQVRVEGAWTKSRGEGAVIAFPNTGILSDHPDLKGRVLPGNTFLNCDGRQSAGNVDGFVFDPEGRASYLDQDGCGDGDMYSGRPEHAHSHTTGEAGVAGATADNGIGMAGVAPKAKLLPVKVADHLDDFPGIFTRPGEVSRFLADLARGIRWSTMRGADVINLSIAYRDPVADQIPTGLTDVKRALDEAIAAGVVVVGASGNLDSPGILCDHPGGHPGAICAVSTDIHGQRSAGAAQPVASIKTDLLTVGAPGGSSNFIGVEQIDLEATVDTTDGVHDEHCDPATGREPSHVLHTAVRGLTNEGKVPTVTPCLNGGQAKEFEPAKSKHWDGPIFAGYRLSVGSSGAAPHVAGVAALLAAQGCDLREIQTLFRKTSRQTILGQEHRGVWTPQLGWGIVDADAATSAALAGPYACERRTRTAATCDPIPVPAGDIVRCVATATDTSRSRVQTPTGTIRWSADGSGSFDSSTCKLSGSDGSDSASCSVTYRPASVGQQTVKAQFGGDVAHDGSEGTEVLGVLHRLDGLPAP